MFFDNVCINSKRIILRHSNLIGFLFVFCYFLLEFILVILVYLLDPSLVKFIVSIFVILLLFVVAVERMVMSVRVQMVEKEKEKIRRVYVEKMSANKVLLKEIKILKKLNKHA